MTDNYAASLARDNYRDRDRTVMPDPQPRTGEYRPWDEAGTPERHEVDR